MLHCQVTLVDAMCRQIGKGIRLNLKHCALLSGKVIGIQQFVILSRAHHVFYLFHQQLILGFELQQKKTFAHAPLGLSPPTEFQRVQSYPCEQAEISSRLEHGGTS